MDACIVQIFRQLLRGLSFVRPGGGYADRSFSYAVEWIFSAHMGLALRTSRSSHHIA